MTVWHFSSFYGIAYREVAGKKRKAFYAKTFPMYCLSGAW
jgi:hypothetical protein